MIEVPSSFTPDQNAQIFQLALLKAQADLQKAQANLQKAQAERDAILAKSQLKLECLRKESEARVAAATSLANAQVPQAPVPRALVGEDDEIQGEIPLKVLDISLQFVGFPQEEIIKIFQNKFKPINLYRFRHIRRLSFEAYKDEERIGIKDGMLKLRKTLGSYKDYSNSFYEVLSEAFINYISILVPLFGATVLRLQAALTQFYGLVLQLSKVYDWKEALLPIAIEIHFHIVTQQPTNPK